MTQRERERNENQVDRIHVLSTYRYILIVFRTRYIDVVACDVLGSQDKNGDKMSSVAKLRKELNYVVTWEKGY